MSSHPLSGLTTQSGRIEGSGSQGSNQGPQNTEGSGERHKKEFVCPKINLTISPKLKLTRFPKLPIAQVRSDEVLSLNSFATY